MRKIYLNAIGNKQLSANEIYIEGYHLNGVFDYELFKQDLTQIEKQILDKFTIKDLNKPIPAETKTKSILKYSDYTKEELNAEIDKLLDEKNKLNP